MDLGSYNVNGGLYLDLIPSLSQMVTGTVPFYVPTNDNKVMVNIFFQFFKLILINAWTS